MFDNDYKRSMDNIKPDGYIKQKVLKKIQEAQKPEKPKKSNLVFKISAAAAACFVVAISVFVFGFGGENRIETVTEKNPYQKAYSAVKQFIPQKANFWARAKDVFSDKKSYAITDESIALYDAENTTNSTAVSVDETGGNNHSETTVQVEGVFESDAVKTDGKYIYTLSSKNGVLSIVQAGKEAKILSTIPIEKEDFKPFGEMYLFGDKLVILGMDYGEPYNVRKHKTIILAYDVADPKKPRKLYSISQSGYYNDSRLVDGKLYLISDYTLNTSEIDSEKPETFVPGILCKNYDGPVKSDTIKIVEKCSSPTYTVVCGYSVSEGSLISTQSILGGIYTLYCSTENIITAGTSDGNTTQINRYSIDNGRVEFVTSGEIEGTLLNQFSIDEHNGNFRFVTTVTKEIKGDYENGNTYTRYEDSNTLLVLNGKLKTIGKIENIAPDERVYSVRFMGDVAYFVTFRQVDPLFSVDLSDPENPQIIGALKIPGFSNYLFPYGEGKLFGIGKDADEVTGKTGGIKLSMFDVSNPKNVVETDKEILIQDYSEALYDHKAILVDYGKNMIGFSTMDYNKSKYFIYGFGDNGFYKIAELETNSDGGLIRGIYIGYEFYIVTDNRVAIYDINTFEMILKLNIGG